MATTNGTLGVLPPSESPDSPTTLPAKRKRDDSIEGSANGTSNYNPSVEESQALVRDLIDVLKVYDTTPSILTRQIPDNLNGFEPQAKRQKGDDSNEPHTNILTRVSTKFYKSLDHVLEDIDIATADITDKLQLPNGAARNQYIPISASQSELSMKVTGFKHRAHELVRRENAAAESNGTAKVNGSASGTGGVVTQINANSDATKVVLTLYGNAPGPKQLFSSLQIPTKVTGETKDILQTIREAGLPNGITTTQIVPIQSTGLINDQKRVPTLGELFPTPATVPAMLPPKPSKVATTRSSTVGWYQPTANDSVPRTASYFRQSISSGQWLDYSNATSLQNTKRKQRERGLSFGGSKVASLDVESVESEASKLDTLFRSAYSGFAPTKDNAAAVAPVGMVDKIWWQQSGERSFSRLVENYESLESATSPEVATEDDTDDELRKFEKLVEDMENDPIDPNLLAAETEVEKSIEEKDVEEILQGISELLDTLNSYQRMRHSSLSSSTRPAGPLAAPDTASLGTPTKPSEPEQNTYEILKSQLTLMIASLPPYAVAKLDPDRLAELSISTKIEVQLNDYKGVMEEDEVAARAKVAAMSAASTSARTVQQPVLHRPSTTALYGNQYAPSPRPVPAAAHQYYNSAQTPIRPPTNNMQRAPATAPVAYQNPRPVSSAPYRPTNYGTPSYPHQAPRPVQQPQQYAPQAQQQYHHAPSAQPYMRPAGQNYQQMPQSAAPVQMNGRYPNQQAYPHQAAAPQNGMSYQYGNGANVPRQASPHKPIYNSPQPNPAQARPSYSTPTPASSGLNRQPYQQTPSQPPALNGAGSHVPQPQFTQQTPTGYSSSFMSASEQATMMDRQRAQLAHQQATAQQQARNAIQASMGSPTRGQPVNGNNPVAANS